MKVSWLLVLVAFSCGCTSSTEPGDLSQLFQEAIDRDGEVVFKDGSQLGADADGSILTLHFRPDAQVVLHTWGNGFSNYSGTYSFTEHNGIELSLEDQSWPRLHLTREGDVFVLRRQDGLNSLTKSYVHTDRETGVRTVVDDGDLYPEARPLIFPLTQRIATAERLSAN